MKTKNIHTQAVSTAEFKTMIEEKFGMTMTEEEIDVFFLIFLQKSKWEQIF